MSDLSIERPISQFDRMVSGAKKTVENIGERVSKRVDTSREALTDFHSSIPATLEAEIVHAQRSMLRTMKEMGSEVLVAKISGADRVEDVSKEIGRLNQIAIDAVNSSEVQKSLALIREQKNDLIARSDEDPVRINQLITEIRAPEITVVHLDPITASIIGGAIGGAVFGALSTPPPPPPPPPRN